MSNGLVHDELTRDIQLPLSFISGGIGYYFTHNIIQAGTVFVLVLAGIELQRFFTPDVDISENSDYKYGHYGFYLIYRDLGKIPYSIIRAWWWPYAVIVPHRHWASHGFIIGTAIRLIYFFIPIVGLGYFLGNILGMPLDRINWHQISTITPYLGIFTLGWFLADCGHLILDFFLFFRNWYENLLGPSYKYHSTIDKNTNR